MQLFYHLLTAEDGWDRIAVSILVPLRQHLHSDEFGLVPLEDCEHLFQSVPILTKLGRDEEGLFGEPIPVNAFFKKLPTWKCNVFGAIVPDNKARYMSTWLNPSVTSFHRGKTLVSRAQFLNEVRNALASRHLLN